MNTKKFVHLDGEGKTWGIVSTEQLWANVYALKYNRPEPKLDRAIWKQLFTDAKKAAVEFGAETIVSRLRQDYEIEKLQSVMSETGLKRISKRIEYQCDVNELPDEAGSPILWKTAKELDWSHAKIAEFTELIIKDALGIEPDEKAETFIQDWLHHDEFTHGLDCIAIGFADNKACALVVAQINQESGWSRLTYMGVITEYRGRGLGKWVHRHGFSMMRNQGGKLYHGGTHTDNLPMKKLFETHGCKVFCEMEEWSLSVKGGS